MTFTCVTRLKIDGLQRRVLKDFTSPNLEFLKSDLKGCCCWISSKCNRLHIFNIISAIITLFFYDYKLFFFILYFRLAKAFI